MTSKTDIQKFFDKKTVFIVGGTGFIGKLVVEKLLRCCDGVERIFMLVRPKNGKDTSERFVEFFDQMMFEPVKRVHKNFLQKITFIEGDLKQQDLGISNDDKCVLINKVDIVINTVSTPEDATFTSAIKINVRGTRDLITLAKQMEKLIAFVHVSTAYSNCTKTDIEEIVYDSDIEPSKIIQMAEELAEDYLSNLQSQILSDFPNTYTLAQNIAEYLLKKESFNMPVSIVRPSFALASKQEPLVGFVDTYAEPHNLWVSSYLGLCRAYCSEGNCNANLIPVDYVVNQIISAVWDTSKKRNNINSEVLTVYNCVNIPENAITWKQFLSVCSDLSEEVKSTHMIWYPFTSFIPNYYVYLIVAFFLQTLPAYLFDSKQCCTGKKPGLVKMNRKLTKSSQKMLYFMNREWYFPTKNTKALIKKMSFEDRELFNFDMATVDWSVYLLSFVKGCRVYILKDPLDSLKKANFHYQKLKLFHFAGCVATIVFIYFLLKLVLLTTLKIIF